MLKKYITKFKALFGAKPKSVSAASSAKSIDSKSSAQKQKPRSQTKPSGVHHPREPHKKETREEYRLRHEKKGRKPNLPITTSFARPAQIISPEPWDDSLFKVPVVDGKTRFHDLDIAKEILHAIYDLGFQYCTQVQAETLPKSLVGDDVTAQAQTGTGKTAAFLVTIFDRILKQPIDKKRKSGTPRALILAPTRELVLQIEKDARGLGKFVPCSILALLGGIDYVKQQKILQSEPCDILICTPGRLIDFMRKKLVDLGKVEILIIDEADRMLDMGFIPSVKQIVIATPQKAKRQTMFFSATMTGDVKRLAESWTRQAFEISV
ncbi:MAG: DEAD/DEAH box helicase, partial [Melioribacteraceae bacterium]